MKIRRQIAAAMLGMALATGGVVATATPAAAHATCRDHRHQVGPYLYIYTVTTKSANGSGGVCYSRVLRINVITGSMVDQGVKRSPFYPF